MESPEQQPSLGNENSNIGGEGNDFSASEGQNYPYPMDSQQQGVSGDIMESNAEYEEMEEGEYGEEGHDLEEHMEGNEEYLYEHGEEEGEEIDQEHQLEEYQEGTENEIEGSGIQQEQNTPAEIRISNSVEGGTMRYQEESPQSAMKKISYDGV